MITMVRTTLQQEGPGSVCTFSPCKCGFFPGTPASSLSSNICIVGQLVNLKLLECVDELATYPECTFPSPNTIRDRLQQSLNPKRDSVGLQKGWMNFLFTTTVGRFSKYSVMITFSLMFDEKHCH